MTLQEKILKLGEDDWVYLAQAAALVRKQQPDAAEETVIDATVSAVSELLANGLVAIGDLSEISGEFEPWALPGGRALERLKQEWVALPRRINLGDVCWLANTLKGDATAALLPPLD
jgi:hypothetical protein